MSSNSRKKNRIKIKKLRKKILIVKDFYKNGRIDFKATPTLLKVGVAKLVLFKTNC